MSDLAYVLITIAFFIGVGIGYIFGIKWVWDMLKSREV